MTDDLTRIAGELEGLRREMGERWNAAKDLPRDADAWGEFHAATEKFEDALRAHAPALIAALRECAAWRALRAYLDSDAMSVEAHANLYKAATDARSATDAAVSDTTERSKQ
jgi:hypothetical protein